MAYMWCTFLVNFCVNYLVSSLSLTATLTWLFMYNVLGGNPTNQKTDPKRPLKGGYFFLYDLHKFPDVGTEKWCFTLF